MERKDNKKEKGAAWKVEQLNKPKEQQVSGVLERDTSYLHKTLI